MKIVPSFLWSVLCVAVAAFASASPAYATWEGRAQILSNGDYAAIVENVDKDGNAHDSEVVGEYETRREAKKAAKGEADTRNGVKAEDCPPGEVC